MTVFTTIAHFVRVRAMNVAPLLRSRPFVTAIVNTFFVKDDTKLNLKYGNSAKNDSAITTVVGGCCGVSLKRTVVIYSLLVVADSCLILHS